jgi:outer membrane protein OmpA-like peptidoglycan-associated protein
MIRLFCLLLFYAMLLTSQAQNRDALNKRSGSMYNEAKLLAQSGDRTHAIDILANVIKKDPHFFMAYFGLADIYHELKNLQKEQEYLESGLRFGADQYPDGYKFLAELLYSNALYDDALKNIVHYAQLKPTLTTVENRLLESCRFSVSTIQSPIAFHPENAGPAINSDADDYWPSLNGEGNTIVFTRLLKTDQQSRTLAHPQEDFFISRKDSAGWQIASPLGPPINTFDNEGAQSLSADGRLLFFTGCGRPDGLGSCDIYMSVKQNEVWSEPINLGAPVNSGAWESQPSISADGKWLYYTSNRSGGKGKMDIWRAERLGVSAKGFPVYGRISNLSTLNTQGNELSPFIHPDGKTLYFASDFWPGLGGNDLFIIELDSLGKVPPRNLGYPLNTNANEEGLMVEVSGDRAWYTASDRGFGGRDIFTFLMPENLKPHKTSWVKCKVIDRKTNRPLASDVVVNDLTSNAQIQHQFSFENEGEFLFCLTSGHNYGFNISKEGYLFHSENYNLLVTADRIKPLSMVISLDPIEVGKITVLKNIFFETDSYKLKPESNGQLKEMVDFLTKNPKVNVEIGGHTDDQGANDYNKILSEKRASTVAKYLTDKGIASTRVHSKGYGFDHPLADNKTDEGRAQNRRTEFKIVE